MDDASYYADSTVWHNKNYQHQLTCRLVPPHAAWYNAQLLHRGRICDAMSDNAAVADLTQGLSMDNVTDRSDKILIMSPFRRAGRSTEQRDDAEIW